MRWVRRVVVAWLVVVVVCVGGGAVAAVLGRRSARALEATNNADGKLLHLPLGAVRAAHQRFRIAADLLAFPAVRPLWLVPGAGRQLRGVAQLAQAATAVTGTTAAILPALRDLDSRARAPSANRVDLLERAVAVARRADDGLRPVHLGSGRGLVGPLQRVHRTVARRLAGARTAAARGRPAAEATLDLLRGPRRYLVLGANNAEMRSGSGMFLTISTMGTDAGRLQLGTVEPAAKAILPPPGLPPGGSLAARWSWLAPGTDFRQLAATPAFDESAALAARMWTARTGERIDGVLSLDAIAIGAMLKATGPVDIEGQTVGRDEVVPLILHDQYVGFADVAADQTRRRDKLGLLAAAVFRAIDGSHLDLPALATGLAQAAAGRHLLAWSSDPVVEAQWRRAGVAGGLTGDDVLVALMNRGKSKSDPFVPLTPTLTLRSVGQQIEGTLHVTVSNRTPLGEPDYVAGFEPETNRPEGAYEGYLAVNLPGRATAIEVPDRRVVVSGPEGPTQVVAVQLRLLRGQSTVVSIRFRLPATAGHLRFVPSARVPELHWTVGSRRFTERGPAQVGYEVDRGKLRYG